MKRNKRKVEVHFYQTPRGIWRDWSNFGIEFWGKHLQSIAEEVILLWLKQAWIVKDSFEGKYSW